METSPIVVAVGAVLAVPAVVSGLTVIVRLFTDRTPVPPRLVVYGMSLLITAGGLVGADFPVCTAEAPELCTTAWLAWATTTGALAEAIYRTMKPILIKA